MHSDSFEELLTRLVADKGTKFDDPEDPQNIKPEGSFSSLNKRNSPQANWPGRENNRQD
jgi:hypothetical protein